MNKMTEVSIGVNEELGAVADLQQARLREDFNEHQRRANAQSLEYSLSDHIKQAEGMITSAVNTCLEIDQHLACVGQFAVFFDMNALRNEGVMDVDKIDQVRLLAIGNQITKDYGVFKQQADQMKVQLKDVQTSFAALKQNPTEDAFEAVIYKATQVQSLYGEWASSFTRLVVSAMQDIAALLNPLRPADRQICIV